MYCRIYSVFLDIGKYVHPELCSMFWPSADIPLCKYLRQLPAGPEQAGVTPESFWAITCQCA